MLCGASLMCNIRTKKHHNEAQEAVVKLVKGKGQRKKFIPHLETQIWPELKLLKMHFNSC